MEIATRLNWFTRWKWRLRPYNFTHSGLWCLLSFFDSFAVYLLSLNMVHSSVWGHLLTWFTRRCWFLGLYNSFFETVLSYDMIHSLGLYHRPIWFTLDWCRLGRFDSFLEDVRSRDLVHSLRMAAHFLWFIQAQCDLVVVGSFHQSGVLVLLDSLSQINFLDFSDSF